MKRYGFLWQADLKTADAIFRQALTPRIITAKHAALSMMPARRGLIVEVTENDMIGGGGNPMSQAVKMAQKVLPLFWAAELAPRAITDLPTTMAVVLIGAATRLISPYSRRRGSICSARALIWRSSG